MAFRATLRAMSAARAIPESMRAVLIRNGVGPASSLYIGEAPTPKIAAAHEVIVRVRAFGLNRLDLLQREGKYPPPPGASDIMGVEFSGTIAEAGADAKLPVGTEVFGLTTGGAYAEYVRVPSPMVLQKSPVMSFEQAAVIPEAFLTAFQALKTISNLRQGEDVLVHAGASGVGIAAIQLARSFGARHVFCTVGAPEKEQFCASLGARPINYKASDWAEELAKQTNGEGVDVIMDFIGAPYFVSNINSLKRDGRLTLQGFLGGAKVNTPFNLALLLAKRLRVEGTTLRSRSLEYQSGLVQDFLNAGGLSSIEKGITQGDDSLRLVIHKTYDWNNIIEAQEEMGANKNVGKSAYVSLTSRGHDSVIWYCAAAQHKSTFLSQPLTIWYPFVVCYNTLARRLRTAQLKLWRLEALVLVVLEALFIRLANRLKHLVETCECVTDGIKCGYPICALVCS